MVFLGMHLYVRIILIYKKVFMETTEYLEVFLRNLLLNEKNGLQQS